MLVELRIENLALMDQVSLEFEAGYTAVTGETGAGKSILLGALSLLSGARGDKSLIRQGEETCTLEAVLQFSDHAELDRTLEEMGLPACEEGQMLVRRQIFRRKGSRVFLNGAIATLAQLQEIGKEWIDFHGPGEPQKLFHESEQLVLLDMFAGLENELRDYRSAWTAWQDALREIESLREEKRLSPEEAAFLKSQVEEIDQLKLSADRIDQLEQDFRRVSGSQELKQLCSQLDEAFLGSKSICPRLESALSTARKLADLDPSAQSLADRVESLVIEAGDLAGEWSQLAGEADFDVRQSRQIEADMEKWMSLRRRFGPSVQVVLDKRQEMADRLELQGDLEGVLIRKEQEAEKMETLLKEKAASLRSGRLAASRKLTREAMDLLRELGFKNPQLGIELVNRKSLGQRGDCDCRMTFSPNPGSDPLPLNKIASSGEMARVMLALKSVLASVDATPVLVFDEVDANIGGEVASSVAGLLKRLGNGHQVFCITHLPQVASVAENHYVVDKLQGEQSTTVTIRCLTGDREARLDEFARLLGDRSSASARRHAASLLGQAG